MKIIITESQRNIIIDLIKRSQEENGEYFDPAVITCYTPEEIPKWVKKAIHEKDDLWEKYIDAFGPIYVIRNGGEWFIAQKHDEWKIGTMDDDIISEFEMLKRLGVAKYGIGIEDLLKLS